MTKSFLLVAASLTALTCTAQDTVVMRHPNGKPALTGPCTFFVNPYVPTDLNHAIVRERREAVMIRRRPFGDYFDMGEGRIQVPDAERTSTMRFRPRSLEITYGLGFSCDGVVRTFYSDGSKEAEIFFNRGVPTGPYAEYYPEGGIAIRCTLDRGMPSGEWTRYYKNGAVYARGNFKTARAALLQDAWQASSNPIDRNAWLEKKDLDNNRPLGESGLRDTEREQFLALNRLFEEFNNLVEKLPLQAVPVGRFVFTHRDGKPLADIFFDTAGHRTGIWTMWKAPGKVYARLEYNAEGELTHVTDTTTKRTTPADYTALWRIRENAEEERLSRMPMAVVGEPVVEAPVRPSPNASGVYNLVDQMPDFPGDIKAYLSEKLRYPREAREAGIEGRVDVRFVVREDGSITDAYVVRGIGGGCDEEALRAVRAMPKWEPGRLNGRPVATYFTLPIKFVQQ